MSSTSEQAVQHSWLLRTAMAWPLGLGTMVLALGYPEGGWSRVGQLLFAPPVQLYAGRPFHVGAARRARVRSATMDTLVALGTFAAYLCSLWALAARVTVRAGTPGVLG